MHQGDFASRCLQLRVRRGRQGHSLGNPCSWEAQGTEGPHPEQAGTFLPGVAAVQCRVGQWHRKDRQQQQEEAELHSQQQERAGAGKAVLAALGMRHKDLLGVSLLFNEGLEVSRKEGSQFTRGLLALHKE